MISHLVEEDPNDRSKANGEWLRWIFLFVESDDLETHNARMTRLTRNEKTIFESGKIVNVEFGIKHK